MAYPTGWYIEGDLPNQVAISTGSTVSVLEGEGGGYPRGPPILYESLVLEKWSHVNKAFDSILSRSCH